MAEAKVSSEEVLRSGVQALLDRLGPANTVRFIAALGGEKGRDSVREVRRLRDSETASAEELVARIRSRAKKRGIRV